MLSISDVKNKNFNLCVVGMGRIGLPLAVSFALQGVKVLGTEKNKEKLQQLNDGIVPFNEPHMEEALKKCLQNNKLVFSDDNNSVFDKCEIIIIAAGTPLKENFQPDMSLIDNVISETCSRAKNNTIIVIRSTIIPGMTKKLIIPKINKLNPSLKIAVCPERMVEGNAMKELRELAEIVGVEDESVGNVVRELFLLLGEKQITITNTSTAEAAKIFANVYRYVNFALANQLAIICEDLNVNARDAIEIANKNYPRSKIPVPGPAAGPCLRKDGYFLSDTSLNLIKISRLLNESIPTHIINTIERKYGPVLDKKIGVLGTAYKADVDDFRDSLAIKLIEELEGKGAKVISYDPNDSKSDNISEVLESEIVILAMNHSEFDNISADKLKKAKLVYDAWGQFKKLDLNSHGIQYLMLGGF